MALWAAFVLETPAGRIYHIGDTGFHGCIYYREVFDKCGGFRLALLSIGAYEPRWFMRDHHQNPQEAVEGMRLAGVDFAVGHHWGVFPLTNEAIDEPPLALSDALTAADIPPQPLPGVSLAKCGACPRRLTGADAGNAVPTTTDLHTRADRLAPATDERRMFVQVGFMKQQRYW